MVGRAARAWRAALLATVAWGTLAPGASGVGTREAVAQPAPAPSWNFAIGPRPLSRALDDFARVTGQSVVFTQGEAEGAGSRGAVGRLTAEQALTAITAGTGWAWRRSDARTVTLAQAAPPVAAAPPVVRTGLDPDAIELQLVNVTARRGIPATATIGEPPPPYAGGQVATGGRLGFLGNRSIFDTPFSQTNITEDYIRNQQARTIDDVFPASASVRLTTARFAPQDNVLIRGFNVNARDIAFDGLYGINNPRRPLIEGAERVEILSGPGALLFGQPPTGGTGAVVNLIPKRAGAEPLTRLSTSFLSTGNVGGAFDVGRRFGPDGAFGVRLNGTYSDGPVAMEDQQVRTGAFTAGLDWRNERVRVSADFGYQHLYYTRTFFQYSILPGFAVPDPPRLDLNNAQRWERVRTDHLFGLLRGEFDITPGLTAYAAFGASDLNERFLVSLSTITSAAGALQVQPQIFDGTFEQMKTGEVGLRGRFTTGPVSHAASLGLLGYFQDSGFNAVTLGAPFASNLYAPVYAPRPNTSGIPSSLPRTGYTELKGVAFADTLSILDERVQLLVGVRGQSAKTRGYSLTGAQTAAYDGSAVTPAVGLVVKPWQPLSLYVSYAEALSVAGAAPATAVNAGEVFPPFVSKQVEVGAKLDLGTVGATAALFQITRPSSLTDPATRVFSISGEQRNRGVELNVFGAPRPDVRVLSGITVLEGVLTQTAGSVNKGKQAPGVGNVQLNVGAEYDLPFVPGLTASGRVLYTSRQYVDQANTQRIPGWATLDLGVRYRFEVERKPLVARFNVLNVTGNNYWQNAASGLNIGTPRTFLFSLSADL